MRLLILIGLMAAVFIDGPNIHYNPAFWIMVVWALLIFLCFLVFDRRIKRRQR